MNIESYVQEMEGLTHKRFNCPVCRGFNSLNISKENSKIIWHCFKDGCRNRGKVSCTKSLSVLKNQIASKIMPRKDSEIVFLEAEGKNMTGGSQKTFPSYNSPLKPFKDGVLEIPEYWVKGVANKTCLSVLEKYHCFDAYKEGLFECAYDPKTERLWILIKDILEEAQPIVAAVGRALSYKVKPKTINYLYNIKNIPAVIGASGNKTVVIVEDVFSAISVTRLKGCTGFALFGTNFKEGYHAYLTGFTDIVIALDRDARKKALKIKRELTAYGLYARVWNLEQDIKDSESLKGDIYE